MSEGPGGPQGATAGGTLAMRMLSQQAMVASQMKRAANDKAIAQMLASKKSGPPAVVFGKTGDGPSTGPSPERPSPL